LQELVFVKLQATCYAVGRGGDMKAVSRFRVFVVVPLVVLLFVSTSEAKIYTGMFGLWGWNNWDEAIGVVSSNKFDIAVGVSSIAVLDKAHNQGLKCIVDFGLTSDVANDEVKWQKYLTDLRALIIRLKDHPAVFAWYLVDEPDWNKIPIVKIRTIRSLVLSLDSKHPMFTVLTIPDRWSTYLPYFDIISVDPYLQVNSAGVREKPDKVRNWLRKVRRDLARLKIRKPIWVVLGAFAQRPKDPAIVSPFVKPTPSEFAEMIGYAIDEKVEGILCFALTMKETATYYGWKLPDDDPLLWNVVRTLPDRTSGKIR
jgi:hypothetical protein